MSPLKTWIKQNRKNTSAAPRRESRYFGISGVQQLIPRDTARGLAHVERPIVGTDAAMRHSAVWASVRLRADIISTLPLDVYRYENGRQVEQPKPAVLVNTGGDRVDITEWLYSSQVELDRTGNSIGIIRSRDSAGYPTRIDLQPTSLCSVIVKNGQLTGYRIAGDLYSPDDVWHEKQYTVSGLHVGLSPVAYAAWTLGEYESLQGFAYNWFQSAAIPRARMRNTQRDIDEDEAILMKESWRASIAMGEPFVYGGDWEYDFIQADQKANDFVDSMKFSVVEIARFFGVPVDLIDGAVSGENITYANLTQRHLQFLVLELGPAITRRERALSRLLPRPKFVKLNGDALLRMDPATRAKTIQTQIESRVLTPDEARALDNREPLTNAQIGQFNSLFPYAKAA